MKYDFRPRSLAGNGAGSEAGALRVENHFCCEQQFLFFFFSPLLAKVFEIRGGGKRRNGNNRDPLGRLRSQSACAPFPAPRGWPEGLCPIYCVPIPAGCCFSMGNVPKAHIPGTSCRNSALHSPPPLPLVPHGGSRAGQCHRRGGERGEGGFGCWDPMVGLHLSPSPFPADTSGMRW